MEVVWKSSGGRMWTVVWKSSCGSRHMEVLWKSSDGSGMEASVEYG